MNVRDRESIAKFLPRVIAVTAALAMTGRARAQPAPAPAPAPDEGRRAGPTLGLAFGGGSNGVALGVEAGALVRPDLAIIGSATALIRGDDHGGALTFLGLGPRLWLGPWFADAQLGEMKISVGCDFEEVCKPAEGFFAGEIGAGVEFVQTTHFGLEVHAADLLGYDHHRLGSVWFAGAGIHVYL